jgi:hypothetical protein
MFTGPGRGTVSHCPGGLAHGAAPTTPCTCTWPLTVNLRMRLTRSRKRERKHPPREPLQRPAPVSAMPGPAPEANPLSYLTLRVELNSGLR